MTLLRYITPLFAAFFFYACSASVDELDSGSARYFSVGQNEDGVVVKVVSPFDSSVDSLVVLSPMESVVCMSTTLVAGFAELGCVDVVKGVSGKNYVSNPQVYGNPDVAEIGYESAMDYETILSLSPEVVLAYAVSSVEPAYVQKLRSLGVRVLMVYDNFESHPLARAEYIRLCAALVGKSEMADSLFSTVSSSYNAIKASADGIGVQVMVNAPYGDAWYVPAKGSYMYRLISDAGGVLLGAKDGIESSMISLETAYSFSREADVWLNPGYAGSKVDLMSMHPSFEEFCHDGLRIYNNTLRMNPEGGNDFYESGAMRPDLVLKDLVAVFSGEGSALEYYIEVK